MHSSEKMPCASCVLLCTLTSATADTGAAGWACMGGGRRHGKQGGKDQRGWMVVAAHTSSHEHSCRLQCTHAMPLMPLTWNERMVVAVSVVMSISEGRCGDEHVPPALVMRKPSLGYTVTAGPLSSHPGLMALFRVIVGLVPTQPVAVLDQSLKEGPSPPQSQVQ